MFDMRKYASHLGRRLNSNDRGVILIWLIVILVVAGILGSSMVYLTTSSTYDELLANNQTRAYYIAEAGGRFAIPMVLNKPVNWFTNLHDKTFTLHTPPGFGDKFHLFLDTISKPKYIKVISTGIVNDRDPAVEEWLEGRRTITYEVEDPSFDELSPVPGPLSNSWEIIGNDFADVILSDAVTDGFPAIRMKNIGPDLQIAVALNWKDNDANPDLASFRDIHGGLLGYALQIKIKIDRQGASGRHYMVGLSFRYKSSTTPDSTYGISFFRSDSITPPTVTRPDDEWINDLPFGANLLLDGNLYLVLWRTGPSPSDNDILGYKLLSVSDKVVDSAGNLEDWSTIAVKVQENFDVNNIRFNTISGYFQGEGGSQCCLRNELNWDFTNPTYNTTIPLIDYTFPSTDPLPEEIAIHAFYDNQANNDLIFDDFALTLLDPLGNISSKYIQH